MSINGISNVASSYQGATKDSVKTVKDSQNSSTANASIDDNAAVYEPSTTEAPSKMTYTQDTDTISKLKADADRRTSQLRSLVEKLLLKQGEKFIETTDIYELLREGKLEVDPETAAQAQADIAEDGYYGVKQTSERLFSFATALTGGDPSKAQEMKDAFIKGYEDAKKAWGGELPEICQKTYEATIQKFDEWMNPEKEKESE